MLETMRKFQGQFGYLADPNTAVAVCVAMKLGYPSRNHPAPTALLATASPCKFKEVLMTALGQAGWNAYMQSPAFPEKSKALYEDETAVNDETQPSSMTIYRAIQGQPLKQTQGIWMEKTKSMIADLANKHGNTPPIYGPPEPVQQDQAQLTLDGQEDNMPPIVEVGSEMEKSASVGAVTPVASMSFGAAGTEEEGEDGNIEDFSNSNALKDDVAVTEMSNEFSTLGMSGPSGAFSAPEDSGAFSVGLTPALASTTSMGSQEKSISSGAPTPQVDSIASFSAAATSGGNDDSFLPAPDEMLPTEPESSAPTMVEAQESSGGDLPPPLSNDDPYASLPSPDKLPPMDNKYSMPAPEATSDDAFSMPSPDELPQNQYSIPEPIGNPTPEQDAFSMPSPDKMPSMDNNQYSMPEPTDLPAPSEANDAYSMPPPSDLASPTNDDQTSMPSPSELPNSDQFSMPAPSEMPPAQYAFSLPSPDKMPQANQYSMPVPSETAADDPFAAIPTPASGSPMMAPASTPSDQFSMPAPSQMAPAQDAFTLPSPDKVPQANQYSMPDPSETASDDPFAAIPAPASGSPMMPPAATNGFSIPDSSSSLPPPQSSLPAPADDFGFGGMASSSPTAAAPPIVSTVSSESDAAPVVTAGSSETMDFLVMGGADNEGEAVTSLDQGQAPADPVIHLDSPRES